MNEARLLKYFFVGFLALAIGYSVYYSVYPKNADVVRKARILCEASISKAQVTEQFMLQAAQARREGAAAEVNPVAAQNDLQAAKEYEADAKKLDSLTVKNCEL